MSERPIERRRWGIDKTHGEEALERMLPVAKEFRAKYDELLAALERIASSADFPISTVERWKLEWAVDLHASIARAAIAKARNTQVTGQGIRPASSD